uniref:Uncharacterized protein n=1 Tax=Rhizophora mucronata TaxID=61149 RepID=A0A2P2Q6V4_RHIMU
MEESRLHESLIRWQWIEREKQEGK